MRILPQLLKYVCQLSPAKPRGNRCQNTPKLSRQTNAEQPPAREQLYTLSAFITELRYNLKGNAIWSPTMLEVFQKGTSRLLGPLSFVPEDKRV